MPKASNAALLFAIKPSKRLKRLVIIVHALALVASMANTLTFPVKISLWVLTGLHYGLTGRRLNAKAVTIKHTESLGWELSEEYDFVSIEILKSTVITTFALFLHYKHRSQVQSSMSGHKKILLVLNDSLADKDYRRLIVKLKTTAIK